MQGAKDNLQRELEPLAGGSSDNGDGDLFLDGELGGRHVFGVEGGGGVNGAIAGSNLVHGLVVVDKSG